MAKRGDRGAPVDGVSGAAAAGPAPFDFGGVLAIADTLPVMVAYLDREQRYRFVNRPIADWFEQPRAAILGRTMREVMGEAAYGLREGAIGAALAGERQWFAAAFDHPTRGALTTQAEYIPHVLPDGQVAGVILVVQDVTEQRAAEVALRESEARFRRIADSAPAPMWVSRADRTRDFVNDAYVEFVGRPRDEARCLDWREILHPDDHDRIVAESIAGEAVGESFELVARYRRGDGEWRWLRSVSQPRRDADGRTVGFIGVATDVTVVKETEIELRRLVDERTAELSASEQRFRAIFDTVLEVVVLLEPDGTVLEVNRTRASWRDPDPHGGIGKKIWDSPTLSQFPEHEPLMREAVVTAARGETFETEVTMERPGVQAAVLNVALQPVRGPSGEVMYLLLESRDITELKSAQEQLRQSQKMEALGQLTGGIAHDFNNLLTVVVGGLDLLTKQVTDTKLQRYAANALAAAERGARLTAQLLAFSRVQRLEVRPTHVPPLIENMRPMLRNVLGPAIRKTFDFDPHLTPVMADPTQFELAILNLAINARDAMPDGGTLSFESRKTRIEGDAELDDGDYIELAIGDTGAGMPPEVVARAFEPFFTTKEVGKGTGLGLSMVYGVTRQSGGTARITSEEGKGTCVKLYFRCAESAGEVAGADGAEGRAVRAVGGGASILVIDDDPDVRRFIADTLADLGHLVREAGDGKSGLARFAEERPDLVVIDYAMPEMSGAEVANRLLALTPDLPILFVSGYSETDEIKRLAPNTPLLAKPFRAEALDEAVRAALGRN